MVTNDVTSRRTQEERSALTRRRLLDATISCLVERGYADTTTTEIAKRAGVSRGAQLHHYPTKAELVAAALEYLARRLGEDLVAEASRLPRRGGRAAAAVDALWSRYQGPLFQAWLELWVAARTDEELRGVLAPLEARLRQWVERQLRDVFREVADRDVGDDSLLILTVYVLQGMALDQSLATGTGTDDGRAASALALLKDLVGAGHPPRLAQAG